MFKKTILHLGMAMGQAGFKGWGFNSCPTSFVLFHLWPASHDKENFLVHPVKLYFLLICLELLQLFLIKPVLLIKIFLKLQINLSHQIKLIFSKN